MNRCSPFKKSWMNQGLKTIAWTLCISGISSVYSVEPTVPWSSSSNPTGGGSGVYVFDDMMDINTINSTVASLFAINGGQSPEDNGQFSDKRYALFFKPGTYNNLVVNVGYYTYVSGLGEKPGDTMLQNVRCPQGSDTVTVGALNTFWRGAENFLTKPNVPAWAGGPPNLMAWAASQACALRRVHVWSSDQGDQFNNYVPRGIILFQVPSGANKAGFSSGGFMADCEFWNSTGTVGTQVAAGSQQQYCARNVNMGSWSDIVWSAMFIGCNGAPTTTDPSGPVNNPSPGAPPPPYGNSYTAVAETPIIAEKPFISFGVGGYYLNIPPVEINKVGSTIFPPAGGQVGVTQVSFAHVYVASPSDSAATINDKISSGLHVVFNPGIYQLDGTIVVNNSNICLLGLGLATLLPPSNGQPCIEVGAVDGVRIAGLLFQANTPPTSGTPTSILLKWGPSGGYEGNIENPGFLYDCYVRVGGPASSVTAPVRADIMLQINNGFVVSDNSWLWRADHDVEGLVRNGDNPCNTAIEVNGNNVKAYGLASEHTLQDMTVWNGDNGQVYFYQAEFPYDVTDSYAANKYVGYRVGPNVQSHNAYGVGVYSFFRDYAVMMPTAFSTPVSSGIHFTNVFTRFLNGMGGISAVINSTGEPVSTHGYGPSYVHQYPIAGQPVFNTRSQGRGRQ